MSDSGRSWGKDPHRLVSLNEAWQAVWRAVTSQATRELPPIGVEQVPLEHALGRVLAAPVHADDDYPAFDKAMMDGFAVRSADAKSAGAALRVAGFVPAGDVYQGRIDAGEAVRINTGAPLPDGADAVVKIEDCVVENDFVTIRTAVHEGQSVAPRGSHRRRGDTVLTPPVRLGPAQIAAAATAGSALLTVARPVGAAVVSTGDELVTPGEPKLPGRIYDSNGPMLTALLRQFGAEPRNLGFGRDTAASLTALFEQALAHPVVLAVGGMSMGTLDLVPQTLSSLGVTWYFHGVEMRPGKPVAYGLGPNGQHVFGLPGNPVSAFVCSWLFARMAVRALQGYEARPPARLSVTLARDIKAHRDSRPAFLPARLRSEEDRGLLAEPCHWGGSGDPFGLAEADALLCLPHPDEPTAAGARVDVICLAPTCD